MNIVRSKPMGQFPDYGIVSDIVAPPQVPDSPIYATFGPEGTTIPATDQTIQTRPPSPSVMVPQSSPIYATFGPYGTLDPTAVAAPGLPPGPSPRVPSTPTTSSLSSLFSANVAGIPIWLLGGGLVLVLAISGGGRRRR